MTLRSREMSEEEFGDMEEHFRPGEIVEVAAVAGIFNYFNRFNNALGVPPTEPSPLVEGPAE